MKARAQFIVFSIAFSLVLSSAEFLVSSINAKVETTSKPSSNYPGNEFIRTQKKENENSGATASATDHELEKRAVKNFNDQSDKSNESGISLEDSNSIFDRDERSKIIEDGFGDTREKSGYYPENINYCGKTLKRNPTLRVLRSFNGFLGKKRAPTAFHGMRGKKSEDYENDVAETGSSDFKDLISNQEFLINSGLIDDGKPVLYYVSPEEEKKLGEESYDDDSLRKRSPYSFQGMRGKKGIPYDLKRTMGFLGMRGKKATEIWDSEGNKRVPQTGFFGMKGKKAQSSGFFGMRGKKASPSAFFGIKGKREPLDYDLQDVSLLNEIKDSEVPKNRIRRGIAWLNNSKKGKNAFFGIRGKKSVEEKSETRFSSSYE